jgi:hypothetical protein
MSNGEDHEISHASERDMPIFYYVITVPTTWASRALFNGVQHVEQSSGGGTLSPFSRELTTTRKSIP